MGYQSRPFIATRKLYTKKNYANPKDGDQSEQESKPTEIPSEIPSEIPTELPTEIPTEIPTERPKEREMWADHEDDETWQFPQTASGSGSGPEKCESFDTSSGSGGGTASGSDSRLENYRPLKCISLDSSSGSGSDTEENEWSVVLGKKKQKSNIGDLLFQMEIQRKITMVN